MIPEFISPAKLILLKCKSAHVPSPLRTLQQLPFSLWKSQSPSRAYEALCLCPTFVIRLLPLFTVCLFSSNNVTCASWTFPDTLAPLRVYSSPCKRYMPSLASGPCSNTILAEMPSLTTLQKGVFSFPFLLTLLYFSLGIYRHYAYSFFYGLFSPLVCELHWSRDFVLFTVPKASAWRMADTP